jgi:hypothetical protein
MLIGEKRVFLYILYLNVPPLFSCNQAGTLKKEVWGIDRRNPVGVGFDHPSGQ